MKKFNYLFILFMFFGSLAAQSPQSFKYQSVVRDNNGDPLINQPVSFRISIVQGSPAGTTVYRETHALNTNDFALANLDIGNGTPVAGDFTTINWNAGPYFLKVELDPAGGSTYQLLGTSQLLSVPYALHASNGVEPGFFGQTLLYDGSWLPNSNLYNDGDHVGIGVTSVSEKLGILKNFSSTNTIEDLVSISRGSTGTVDIGEGAGLIFRNETSNGGYALSGRIASVLENATVPNTSAGMLIQTREPGGTMNDAIYINSSGNVGIGMTTPYYKLNIEGDYYMRDYFPFITLNNLTTGGNAGLSFETEGAYNGWIYYNNISDNLVMNAENGAGYRNDLVIHNNGNVGINTELPNARLQVRYDDNNYQSFGFASIHGSYYYHNELPANGDGQTSLYAFRTRSAANDGLGYTVSGSNTAILGYSYWGDQYSFGTAGFNYNDYFRCGGILGASVGGSYWGSLGYKTSGGSTYGGYFTSYTSGLGKSSDAETGIGIGAWGDLFGADIHGKVYGAYFEGGSYATYANGTSFHKGLDVHLQDNGSAKNTVLYSSVSTAAIIQTSGYATISGGEATIAFDPAFSEAVSGSEPVVVTVTPLGNSNGFYLTQVDETGFGLTENNNGKSNVTVSYIAIGQRKGYENPQLPQEVMASDYTAMIGAGLNNDNDTETAGEGLYYENGQLKVGIHASLLPQGNKPVQAENPEPQPKEPQATNLDAAGNKLK